MFTKNIWIKLMSLTLRIIYKKKNPPRIWLYLLSLEISQWVVYLCGTPCIYNTTPPPIHTIHGCYMWILFRSCVALFLRTPPKPKGSEHSEQRRKPGGEKWRKLAPCIRNHERGGGTVLPSHDIFYYVNRLKTNAGFQGFCWNYSSLIRFTL